MSGYGEHVAHTQLAEPREGSFAQAVAALAQSHKTCIVYGYPERVGDRIFNSAACMDRQGCLVAHHRKTLLPPGYEVSRFDSGDEQTLFDLNGVVCALLICYEAEFPEAVRAVAHAGAQLVIVPTALSDQWATVAHKMMPTRAFENGVWLMYANHAGHAGETRSGLRYLGASCIVAPDGRDAARAGTDEQLIISDMDVAEVIAAQTRLPYVRTALRWPPTNRSDS